MRTAIHTARLERSSAPGIEPGLLSAKRNDDGLPFGFHFSAGMRLVALPRLELGSPIIKRQVHYHICYSTGGRLDFFLSALSSSIHPSLGPKLTQSAQARQPQPSYTRAPCFKVIALIRHTRAPPSSGECIHFLWATLDRACVSAWLLSPVAGQRACLIGSPLYERAQP